MKRRLTPWQKIIRAGDRGTGLRLDADEVWRLRMDGAIETVAAQDDEADEARREAQRESRRDE